MALMVASVAFLPASFAEVMKLIPFFLSERSTVYENLVKLSLTLRAFSSVVVIFRSILRLHDQEVPYRAVDIIDKVSNYLSFNKMNKQKLARVRWENEYLDKKYIAYTESELFKDIQNILKQIDVMMGF